MSKFKRIKDAQIAMAIEAGLDDPYESGEMARTQRPERVSKLKKLQNKQAERVGFDLANGPDETVSSQVVISETGAPASLIVGNPDSRLFENLKAAMETDLQRLSTKKVIEEKAAMKRELLPTYLDFVNKYIEQGHNYPNSVAVMVMIWLFDVDDIEKAVTLGLYLAKTPLQVMPERFNSDLVTFICDYTYDWAAKQIKDKQSASPYLEQVVDQMIEDKWSLSPVVEGKLYNRMANNAFVLEDYQGCVNWSEKAEQVNPDGHGTKTVRKEAMKKLEDQAAAQAETAAGDPAETEAQDETEANAQAEGDK